jgi:hypothetical protein
MIFTFIERYDSPAAPDQQKQGEGEGEGEEEKDGEADSESNREPRCHILRIRSVATN